VARILAFQTNTDTKHPPTAGVECLDAKIFDIASYRRWIVINRSTGAVTLSFPRAWWPFIVRPSAKLTHS
jgi:hypothetical protein